MKDGTKQKGKAIKISCSFHLLRVKKRKTKRMIILSYIALDRHSNNVTLLLSMLFPAKRRSSYLPLPLLDALFPSLCPSRLLPAWTENRILWASPSCFILISSAKFCHSLIKNKGAVSSEEVNSLIKYPVGYQRGLRLFFYFWICGQYLEAAMEERAGDLTQGHCRIFQWNRYILKFYHRGRRERRGIRKPKRGLERS